MLTNELSKEIFLVFTPSEIGSFLWNNLGYKLSSDP